MARPLEPFSEKKIREYEKKLKAAKENNDKDAIKRYKHYFREYITRRGLTVNDFEGFYIYRYFKVKVPRIDELEEQIQKIKSYWESHKNEDGDDWTAEDEHLYVKILTTKENELKRLKQKPTEMRERRRLSKIKIKRKRIKVETNTLQKEIKKLQEEIERIESICFDYEMKIHDLSSLINGHIRDRSRTRVQYRNFVTENKKLKRMLTKKIERLETLN